MLQTNVIHLAHQCGCKKLGFLGSSCIYPKESPQPMKEEYYLTILTIFSISNRKYSINFPAIFSS
jgi:nucleoside-diphosphate-sugar epimerase